MTLEFISQKGDKLFTLPEGGIVLILLGLTAGLALALMARVAMDNLVAGLLLKRIKPFKLDDTIACNGAAGRVISIGWLHTAMVDADSAVVRVANQHLINGVLVNTTMATNRRILMDVVISPGEDIDGALDMIEEVLSKDQRLLLDPPPRVALVGKFTCGGVLRASFWVPAGNREQVRSDIAASVGNLFDAEEVEQYWIQYLTDNSSPAAHCAQGDTRYGGGSMAACARWRVNAPGDSN
jgi:small-conductance mechanosensitive channel